MAAIWNSSMLDSDTLFSSLSFTPKHSHSTLTLTQTNINVTQTYSFWLNLMMAPILNSTILDSSHLSSSTQSHSHLTRLVPTICTKKPSLIHCDSTWWWQSSWILRLSMIGFPDSLFSSPRFTQKHSHSTLTLTQTNSMWLKLIHSHSTWWWQPSWILPCLIQTLPSWIQTPCYLLSDSLKNTLTPLWIKLIQSDSNSFILT